MLDTRDHMMFGAMNSIVQTAKLEKENTAESSGTVETKTAETKPETDTSRAEAETKAESVPDLSIEEAKKESKDAAKHLRSPKNKSIQPEKEIVKGIPNDILNSLSVEDIYEKLMESDEYYPTVDDIEAMSDDELDQAYRYKLISEALTPDRFLFIWFLGSKNIPRSFKKQYMIKAKTFDKGYKHVLDNVRKSANGNGVHHSTIMKLFYEFLERDEAMYEAQKAKEEAERKAKAAEKAKKAKEKTKKSKTSKKDSKPATAKSTEKPAKEKAATKKASALKAATDDSVLSLFNMV